MSAPAVPSIWIFLLSLLQESDPPKQWFEVGWIPLRENYAFHHLITANFFHAAGHMDFLINLFTYFVQIGFLAVSKINNYNIWMLVLVLVAGPLSYLITSAIVDKNNTGFAACIGAVGGASIAIYSLEWRNLTTTHKMEFISPFVMVFLRFFVVFIVQYEQGPSDAPTHWLQFVGFIVGYLMIHGYYKNKFKSKKDIGRSVIVTTIFLIATVISLFVIFNAQIDAQDYRVRSMASAAASNYTQ